MLCLFPPWSAMSLLCAGVDPSSAEGPPLLGRAGGARFNTCPVLPKPALAHLDVPVPAGVTTRPGVGSLAGPSSPSLPPPCVGEWLPVWLLTRLSLWRLPCFSIPSGPRLGRIPLPTARMLPSASFSNWRRGPPSHEDTPLHHMRHHHSLAPSLSSIHKSLPRFFFPHPNHSNVTPIQPSHS